MVMKDTAAIGNQSSTACVSPDKVNSQAQMGVAPVQMDGTSVQIGMQPVEMGVISAQVESKPIMVPQNSYQLKQPVHNPLDQAAQFQINQAAQLQANQAAQLHFAPVPQYVSQQQQKPPLSDATGQQMPQFPQHQTQLLPQQLQLQAQMQTSHPQLIQTIPSLSTRFRTACPLQCLNEGPAPVDCPSCGARELTRTEYDVGETTHGWAVLCCFFTLLFCIPYMMDDFKDVNHYCSHCGTYLARWHRSGRTVVKVY